MRNGAGRGGGFHLAARRAVCYSGGMKKTDYPVAAVLMAAGVSARYGAENKLLAPVAGRPMICHLADRLAALPFSQHLAVVRDPAAADLLRPAFTVIPNDTEDLSVRRTVRLAVEAVSPEAEGALFCVADQPLLTAETVLRLCDVFLRDPTRIVTLSWQGKRGNPVLFPRSVFPELLDLAENEAGRAVLKRHPERVTTVEAAGAFELYDVDTAAQLAALPESGVEGSGRHDKKREQP